MLETNKNNLAAAPDSKIRAFKDASSPRCNLWEKQMGNWDIIIYFTEVRSVVLAQSEKQKGPTPSPISTEEKQCMKKYSFSDSTCIGIYLTVPSKYMLPRQCKDEYCDAVQGLRSQACRCASWAELWVCHEIVFEKKIMKTLSVRSVGSGQQRPADVRWGSVLRSQEQKLEQPTL